MKGHYFITDLRRLLKGKDIYVAILGLAISLLFSLENVGLVNNSVVETYVYATEMSGMMIAYVFCAFSYATSLCDDMEYKYMYYQTVRGSLKRYVLSKVSVIYLTSIITMILGSMMFILVYRTQGPWVDLELNDMKIYMVGVYSGLLKEGHYILYCIFYALQLGFLAGILSVFAAFLSLYITNKMTVLVLPVLIYQILLECAGSGMFTVFIFRAYNKPLDQDWKCLLFVFMLSIVLVAVLTMGIYKKIKTRM